MLDNIENNIDDENIFDLTKLLFKVLASSRELVASFEIYQLSILNDTECIELFYTHMKEKKMMAI